MIHCVLYAVCALLLIECTLGDIAYDTAIHTPFVIGHRGYSSKYPENTILSYSEALKAGADGFETDVRLTKDNVVVLHHNSGLGNTNCTGRVKDYTFDELRVKCKIDGVHNIPTFDEALDLLLLNIASDGFERLIVIDVKEEATLPSVSKQILANKAEDFVVMFCWSFTCVDKVKSLLNITARMKLDNPKPMTPSQIDHYLDTRSNHNIRGVSVKQDIVTPTFVRRAHLRVFSVFVWTPNSIMDIARLIRQGVDGIVTNEVERAIKLRNDQGRDYLIAGEFFLAGTLVITIGITICCVVRIRRVKGRRYAQV